MKAAAEGEIQIALQQNYGYVIIVGVLIGFQVLLIGFLFPGRARGQLFTEEYMKKHFGQEHINATGKEIVKGGYPDMGSGRYS